MKKIFLLNVLNNKKINIINIDYKFKKNFNKISKNSNTYIENCFNLL